MAHITSLVKRLDYNRRKNAEVIPEKWNSLSEENLSEAAKIFLKIGFHIRKRLPECQLIEYFEELSSNEEIQTLEFDQSNSLDEQLSNQSLAALLNYYKQYAFFANPGGIICEETVIDLFKWFRQGGQKLKLMSNEYLELIVLIGKNFSNENIYSFACVMSTFKAMNQFHPKFRFGTSNESSVWINSVLVKDEVLIPTSNSSQIMLLAIATTIVNREGFLLKKPNAERRVATELALQQLPDDENFVMPRLLAPINQNLQFHSAMRSATYFRLVADELNNQEHYANEVCFVGEFNEKVNDNLVSAIKNNLFTKTSGFKSMIKKFNTGQLSNLYKKLANVYCNGSILTTENVRDLTSLRINHIRTRRMAQSDIITGIHSVLKNLPEINRYILIDLAYKTKFLLSNSQVFTQFSDFAIELYILPMIYQVDFTDKIIIKLKSGDQGWRYNGKPFTFYDLSDLEEIPYTLLWLLEQLWRSHFNFEFKAKSLRPKSAYAERFRS